MTRNVDIHDQYATEPNSGCWLWLGADDGRKGYGRVNPSKYGQRQAHRVMYEMYKGPIPSGLIIDHKCKTPSCVNPDHMEPVTNLENMKRGRYREGLALGGKANGKRQQAKTHCPSGHEYTVENTYIYNGWRQCRPCHAARERKRRTALRMNGQGGL
jgi:hypothetical protein